jgi:hypothetical protein
MAEEPISKNPDDVLLAEMTRLSVTPLRKDAYLMVQQ